MEKKLRTIDYELEQTEKRLEDLLAGIKQLRKEVHDMLPKEFKKAVHERVVLDRNKYPRFINLEDFFSDAFKLNARVINIVRYSDGDVSKYDSNAAIGVVLVPGNLTTKHQVIMTYIPSENVVIVVER